ncbi:MAG: homoprotocatechuate degradation operon regulator HpaR [Rhodoblastus sp.]|jgi:homoprotocatechuate degradation regulator HpaR
MSEADTRPASPVRIRHFSRSLPMSLLRAREAVMRHFRPALRRHGMTEQQWRVLRALMTRPHMEVSELADATFLLGPSVSRILRDLEALGLITRRQDKADQRRSIIALSADGEALIERVSPQSETIYAEITRRYGAQKLAELQNMLRELEIVLSEGPPIEGEAKE